MAAFYVERVEVHVNLDPEPVVLVEPFERDREVLLRAASDGLFIGYEEGDVSTDGDGFPLGTALVRFVLPADASLWIGENASSPSTIAVDVLVGAA